MPIYEYYSPDTHKVYSFFARSLTDADRVPRCPDDAAARMEKTVSAFAVTGRAKEAAEGGEADLDDPKMEAAMAQLEREMAGIDDDHPDPRQLGHLMRRMSELTGERLPGEMEEMVRRLEKGEDPDKLEEEYSGVLDDEGLFAGDEAGPDGAVAGGGVGRWWRRQRPAERDPQLYELNDYL